MSSFLVFGGELFNKGAQSMTFIVVDELAKRFPESKVVLISTRDYGRDEDEKKNYRFKIVKSPSLTQKVKMIFRGLPLKKDRKCLEFIELMKSAKGVIDISGYALGSNWGAERNLAYLTRVILAKSFKIPIWLFPQSFGPFEVHGIKDVVFALFARKYLPYANIIMARENEGKEMLEKSFHLTNVIKTNDMVLQNTGIDLGNIYVKIPPIKKIDIKRNSVAVIPNTKNYAYSKDQDVLALYRRIVDRLIDLNRYVYLIYHSAQDYKICVEIKDIYKEYPQVKLIEDELSCVDYSRMIGEFDFIIASRYHSIVHAYRKGIPAIILGWATKYRELAACVGQNDYVFDVREAIDTEYLLEKINKMSDECTKESELINEYIEIIQKENVFCYLQASIDG